MSDPALEGEAKRGPVRATSHLAAGQQAPEPQVAAETTTTTTSVARLLRQLVDDVTLLVRKELALATSEISHSIDEAKTGAGAVVGGGAVMYAGLLFLLAAATLGLAEVMPGWLAALIVGGVVTLIGVIMFLGGKRKIQPGSFTPQRTADALRKDRDMIERQTHEG